jgi:hypothetical protein
LPFARYGLALVRDWRPVTALPRRVAVAFAQYRAPGTAQYRKSLPLSPAKAVIQHVPSRCRETRWRETVALSGRDIEQYDTCRVVETRSGWPCAVSFQPLLHGVQQDVPVGMHRCMELSL